MSLIIYPADLYNSFVPVIEADFIIGMFVTSAGKTAYLALDEAGKEAILAQTCMQIRLCSNITLPAAPEPDLEYAQCYLAVHALEVDMMSYDATSDSVISEKVGELEVKYDSGIKATVDTFPPMVNGLLSQYGCNNTGGGYSQSRIAKA